MESSTALSKMFTQARNDQAAWRKITDKNGEPEDFIFLDVNPLYEKITGLKKEEIIRNKF